LNNLAEICCYGLRVISTLLFNSKLIMIMIEKDPILSCWCGTDLTDYKRNTGSIPIPSNY